METSTKTEESAENVSTSTKSNMKKPTMLYDKELVQQLLSGLVVVVGENDELSIKVNSVSVPATTASAVFDKTSCSTCSCTFSSRDDQVGHFKSDWHRLNLKRVARGNMPITDSEFALLTGEDVSSISGSDSSTSSDDDSEVDDVSETTSVRHSQQSHGSHGNRWRRHKMMFRNGAGEVLAIQRCVIGVKKETEFNSEDLIRKVQNLPLNMHWAVLMASGGHFAGAVFDGATVTHHKTFHRYVVRAKRGTSQGQHDNKSKMAKSAGASLRRYNEAAFSQEIKDLLVSWSAPLAECSRIFLRCPGYNRAIFFGGKTPVFNAKSDPRLSFISIETRRPTFRELKRVHGVLAAVEYVENTDICDKSENVDHTNLPKTFISLPNEVSAVERDESQATELQQVECRAERNSQQMIDDSRVPSVTTELINNAINIFESDLQLAAERVTDSVAAQSLNSDEDDVFDKELYDTYNRLYTACKTGNTETVAQILDSVRLASVSDGVSRCLPPDARTSSDAISDVLWLLVNHRAGPKLSTLLHTASRAGHVAVVRILLENGADPALKDAQNQLPYVIAGSKEVKQEFRRFMADHMEMYDYVRAQIPGPLTEQMEIERKAKAAEKKKLQRKAKKEKVKELKAEEEKRQAEDEKRLEEERRKQEFLSMSDREKRAFAAEQRLKMQLGANNADKPQCSTGSRCWMCGVDMTGRIPFEYFDYKFCSPLCLKEHRQKNA